VMFTFKTLSKNFGYTEYKRGGRGRDRMVVGFATACVMSA